jgi:hypothetical protein
MNNNSEPTQRFCQLRSVGQSQILMTCFQKGPSLNESGPFLPDEG